jgi:hypothetical protein
MLASIFLKSKKNRAFVELEETSYFSERNAESQLVHQENVDIILSLINFLPPKCQLIFKLIKDDETNLGIKGYQTIIKLMGTSSNAPGYFLS